MYAFKFISKVMEHLLYCNSFANHYNFINNQFKLGSIRKNNFRSTGLKLDTSKLFDYDLRSLWLYSILIYSGFEKF